MAEDAYELLGDSYFRQDFDQMDGTILIEGVGSQGYRAIPLDTVVHFEDEADSSVSLFMRVWIAEPNPDYPSLTGNWALPSILGRDAIRPGDFELSYIKGTATLIRPDDE